METELVFTGKGDIFCDSLKIAEKLEVPHRDLLRTIEGIILRQKQGASQRIANSQKFVKSTFTNKQNRTYDCYHLNEPAFIKLVMQLKGYEKAEIVQDMFVEAFMYMKNVLAQHSNASWIESREQGKLQRREETDKIQEFIEYAKGQGSTQAQYYYAHFTKMTYRALEILNHDRPIRDILSKIGLTYLCVAEDQVVQSLEEGMKQGLHYKEIYAVAKARLEKFCEYLPEKTKLLS